MYLAPRFGEQNYRSITSGFLFLKGGLEPPSALQDHLHLALLHIRRKKNIEKYQPWEQAIPAMMKLTASLSKSGEYDPCQLVDVVIMMLNTTTTWIRQVTKVTAISIPLAVLVGISEECGFRGFLPLLLAAKTGLPMVAIVVVSGVFCGVRLCCRARKYNAREVFTSRAFMLYPDSPGIVRETRVMPARPRMKGPKVCSMPMCLPVVVVVFVPCRVASDTLTERMGGGAYVVGKTTGALLRPTPARECSFS